MSCVLRTSGEEFDVDVFLNSSPLNALIVVHRGDEQLPEAGSAGRRHECSGMKISVSTREFCDLTGQIEDAIRFLLDNAQELRRLHDFPGVETVEFDFPIEDREVIFQSDAFPPQLLALMGELGIGLVVSRYPAPDIQQT